MNRFRSTASTTVIFLVLWLVTADFARAANLSWNNAAGGLAGLAANWNPAQVPVAADWLTFALNNTYTVTFGSSVTASEELRVVDGNVSFRFNSPHTNSLTLALPVAGVDADLTVRSGSLTLLNNLFVGQTAGRTGTLNVTGNGTFLSASSAAGVTSIGDQGTGTLNVSDGATVTLANSPEFGDRAGGLGTLSVAGVSAVSPFLRSQLIVNNSPTDPVEFGSNGTGNAGVLSGARMSVAGSVFLGKNPGGSGAISVALSAADSARLEVGTDLHVGRNDVAGTQSGTGLASVLSGGVIDVAGTTYTFDPDGGGNGQVEIRTGGRFETGSLIMDDPATQLDITGGTLAVRGGTLDTGGKRLTLNSATGTPMLELRDGAQSSITSAAGPALVVGEDAAGTLRVVNNSHLTVTGFNAIVGDDPGGNGVLEVTDPGSTLTVDKALLVGRAGGGRFDATNEMQGTLFSLGVSTQPTGDGTVHIRDSGTDLVITDLLEVSGTEAGGSGVPGLVEVSDDGVLWLDRPGISGHIWPKGKLTVLNGASLRLAGTLVDRGGLWVHDGVVEGGVVQPIEGGALRSEGTSTVHASVVAPFDTTGLVIVPNGHLTVGDENSPAGFFLGGRLTVGGNVTLLDADSAVVGNIDLAYGTLYGPPGGIHTLPDRKIHGAGTIAGPVRPAGKIIASDPEGITFTGALLGVGQGVSGTRLHFGSGGGFLGAGRLGGGVQVDAGSAIVSTGDLQLGRAPEASAVTLDGVLAIAPGADADIEGTDSTRVNGLISLAGGDLSNLGTSPLAIRPAGRIAGHGAVLGTTLNGGTIDPGAGPRRLSFETLLLLPSSRISFDVGDYVAGELDTLAFSGPLTVIAGTLDLRPLPGFAPVAGDSFQVLSYVSHSGAFGAVTLNGNPANGLEVVYRANGAWVRILGPLAAPGPSSSGIDRVQLTILGSPSRAPAFAVELPEASEVSIDLFDVGGRHVARIHDGALPAGRHRLEGGPSGPAPAGLYFARATVRGSRGTVVRTARLVRTP